MKYLFEYNKFIDKIDFADLKTKDTTSRSKPLSKEQFIKLFLENCKNFSFNNTQLYRGNILKQDTDFFYIDNSEIRGNVNYNDEKPYYQGVDYNIRLKGVEFSDLPDRNRAIIGSTNVNGAMITVGNPMGPIERDRIFIMIPYDNVQIAVAPVLDLRGYITIHKHNKFHRNEFELLRYTKNFNINEPGSNNINKSKEIWTEGPVLLVRYNSIKFLKKLSK